MYDKLIKLLGGIDNFLSLDSEGSLFNRDKLKDNIGLFSSSSIITWIDTNIYDQICPFFSYRSRDELYEIISLKLTDSPEIIVVIEKLCNLLALDDSDGIISYEKLNYVIKLAYPEDKPIYLSQITSDDVPKDLIEKQIMPYRENLKALCNELKLMNLIDNN